MINTVKNAERRLIEHAEKNTEICLNLNIDNMTQQEIKQKMRLTLWQKFLVCAMKRMIRLCEKNKLELCIDNEYFTLGLLNKRNISEYFYGEENFHNHTYEVGDYIEDIHEPYIHDRFVWADFKED